MAPLTVRDGCRLEVETTGAGPALVLIPGLGGSAIFWSAMLPALAADRLVVTFDHRGAGRSERPEGTYSIEGLADDLVDILDALGLAHADLLGHSTGGAIAQLVAAKAPERVRSLILSATWHRPDLHFRTLFEARLAVLEILGPEAYARLTQVIGYLPDWLVAHPELVEHAVARASADLKPLSVAAARIRMLLAFAGLDDLSRIRQPTLVVGAKDDMIVAFGQSVALADGISGAHLLAREGGHFFPRIQPDRFVADVLDFLRAVP